MWNNLPYDILAKIFSNLSPDSLACAKSACRNWYDVVEYQSSPQRQNHHRFPWFLAFPTRISKSPSCYIHNPIKHNWHVLPLDFITSPIKPVATVNGLMLLKLTSKTALQLAICNPFTRQFKTLPTLSVKRTNPALGLIETSTHHRNKNPTTIADSSFKIYAAGGMSEASHGGGALYQPTVEMYDSLNDTWQMIGPMPVEFAVRLTVWTSSEGVLANGVLYWITSARAYSIIGFEIETNQWRELGVPMADRLEFASLVSRNGNLAIVGGACEGGAFVWELRDYEDEDDDVWCVVEKVPFDLGVRAFGDRMSWDGVKCVGYGGLICLYRDLGSGFITWRGKWELDCIEGCCEVGGVKKILNVGVKGLFIEPNLSRSCFF